jgi:serine protease Do
MDDKDRLTVTFDNDFSYEAEVPPFTPEAETVKDAADKPAETVMEVRPAAADPMEFAYDGPAPGEDAPVPAAEIYTARPVISDADPLEPSGGDAAAAAAEPGTAEPKVEDAYTAAPHVSDTGDTKEAEPMDTGFGSGSSGSEPPIPPKPPVNDQNKYVTKGLLVTFMVITMLVSSVLGAVGGVLFSRTTAGGSSSRDDSKLSQLNLSDATGSELTVSEIVEKTGDSVVEIVVSGTTQGMWGQLQLTQGAGSGIIVRKDGYIATNYHVIDGANKVEVTLRNGETYTAKIIGSDQDNDIAVIKIDAKDLTPATIGDSSQVEVGDLAVAIGNPLGQLGGTATAGIVSALDRTLTIEGTTLTLLQTDAAINGGNSGGGLFNSKGELIGVVESKASAVGVEGLAFALPINSVSEIINDMIENGGSATTSKSTPAVGVVISEVSDSNAQYYGLESAGVYIAQVTGQNAQKAGFQERDRVVSIDGQEIKSSNDFITIVRKHKVGDTVSVVVSRNGQEIEIKTELEELSDTQPSQQQP